MTLDEIMARCVEEGDCMVWQGRTTAHGLPVHGTYGSIRRLAWKRKKGDPGKRVVQVSCDNPRCLEHLKLGTKAGIAKAGHAKPDMKMRHGAAVARVMRARHAVITEAIAAEIRASTETIAAISEKYGLSRRRTGEIRNNKCWKQYGKNPFAGLGGLLRPTQGA